MNEKARFRVKNVLPVVTSVSFLGFLDTNLLIPVIALYAAELGAGVGTIGIIVGLYSITNTPANILWGRLIDRIGYKSPLVVSLFGDALSMFLYSVCRLPFHLALVRVLHGITGAATGPATMSAIANDSSGTPRGRSMAFYGMSIGIATLVGFGLSGVLASRLGFRAVFLFGAGLPLIGVVLSMLLPGNRKAPGIERISVYGGGWNKVKDLFKRRGLIVSYSAIFAHYFTFGGVVTLLPLYVKTLGMEAFHIGMMMAVFAVVFIILQLPVGSFSDRAGRWRPAAIGLGLGVVALALMPEVTTFVILMMLMAVYGAAFGFIFPSVSAMVSDSTGPEERGMATGIFHALLTAGVAIGAPVLGWVGGLLGVQLGLMLSAGILVLALLVTLGIRKPA